jgi:hypothetical protein
VIPAADQVQVDLGEGPSLRAIADHDDVRVKDTTTDIRWPKVGAPAPPPPESAAGWRSGC